MFKLDNKELGAYFIGIGIPLAIMFVASLVAYRMEGNLITRDALKKR